MPKGSKPAGQVTQTQTNPLQVAQQPYLTGIWDIAKNQYQSQPWQYYPGQTLSQAGVPERTSGYQGIYNTGASYDQALRPQTNAAYQAAIGGGYGIENSPAYGGYQSYAQGTARPQQDLYGLQQTALAQGQRYADSLAGYAPQQQAAGAQGGTLGQQYAQQLAQQAGQGGAYGQQYAGDLAQQGAQGAAAGGQYGQQIGQYADPAYAYGATAALNNNGALNSLLSTAQGKFLNSNPYLDQAIKAAQDPTQRAYQTAIAPSTDAMFSGGGRYGSGAMAGAVNTGQQNLVRGLGDISTNMSNANYGRERQLMDQAAQQYGQLYNQGLGLGITGATAAGNLQQAAGNMALSGNQQALSGLAQAANAALSGNQQALSGLASAGNTALSGNQQALSGLQGAASTQQGAGNMFNQYLSQVQNALQQQMLAQQYGVTGLQGGYQSGNAAALQALGQAPNIAALQFTSPRAQLEAGQGLGQINQATLDDLRKRFEGEQQAPWTGLGNYQSAIGGALGGSGTSSQPYFQNKFADALSGIAGVAGIGNNLGLFGGSGGGLLGGLGGLGGSAAAGLGAAAPWVTTAAASAAPIELAMLGSAAPAMAATVICTELVRQKRMPNRWRLAGMRQFASYPEMARRGYHVWAIPTVRHLRRRPDSLFSRAIAAAFLWRAEDLAARAGLKGARRLWRGRAVTAAMVLPCLVLGALCRRRDWRVLYRDGATA